MEIIELNRDNAERLEEKWDEYLSAHKDAHFFHSLEWKRIVERVYGFRAVYLLAVQDGRVKGILPSFFTKSILFGKKMTTAPFNFYGGPLFDDVDTGNRLVQRLIEEGKNMRAAYVQLKPIQEIDEKIQKKAGLIKEEQYFISNLNLEGEEDIRKKYYKRLRKNLRTMYTKMKKSGFFVREVKSDKELEQWYDIMVSTLRDKHQMIAQPYLLFKELYHRFGKEGSMKINVMVNDKNKIIGGVLIIFYRNDAVYAWGASDQRYKTLNPSTILVDNMIDDCCRNKIKNLDFGVTSPTHTDLLFFKNNWGCETRKIPNYYRLITAKEIPRRDYHRSYRVLRKPFRLVPVWLIKKMCHGIVRHLA